MNDLYKQNGISAYNKAVSNTPQVANMVVLYDGVMRHLTDARAAYHANQKANMLKLINKAGTIFVELQKALDAKYSQQLYDRLDAFYSTSIIRISQQPGKKFDDAQFRSLLAAIRSVRNAWAEVAGVSVRNMTTPSAKSYESLEGGQVLG